MDTNIQKIIQNCLAGNFSHDEKESFDNTRVYRVDGEDGEEVLYFWNSANSERISTDEVLKEIVNELLEDNCDGSVNDYYKGNEIMFEIKNKA